MIISASRRTDIPAFYSDWFMNRVRKGFFYRVNPFNSKQVSGFSLKPEGVDAICFWTKNPKPLMKHLDELDQRGLKYYFQFTLNPYDKTFEPHLPPLDERIATFRELACRICPERVIWRYDPVILSSVTPVSWHLEQAERIAEQLKDSTHRLVFSFYDVYGKVQARLINTGISFEEITAPEKSAELDELVRGFKAMADSYGVRILSCSEEIDLSAIGIEHGACIDGKLVRKLFEGEPSAKKDRNQRESCGCVESVDMGMYNTCRFRCSYCYANFNERMIDSNYLKHYPDSPALLGRYEGHIEIHSSLNKKKTRSVNRRRNSSFEKIQPSLPWSGQG
jgi:DNA repair photolyase